MPPDEMREASREAEIAEWRASNRFCGRCGAEMKPHDDPNERALVCPGCGYTVYPRISPAVIVLVTKGDKVLLQRNTHYRGVVWSLVAGFVAGIVMFGESASALRIASAALIVAGIVGLKLAAK